MAHDPRTDLSRITVTVLAVTGRDRAQRHTVEWLHPIER
jgi:hypothetical protein